MYCRNCYARLDPATETACPGCGRPFDARDPRTYSARPFPDVGKIVMQLITTTFLGLVAAYVVAMFQAVGTSGH